MASSRAFSVLGREGLECRGGVKAVPPAFYWQQRETSTVVIQWQQKKDGGLLFERRPTEGRIVEEIARFAVARGAVGSLGRVATRGKTVVGARRPRRRGRESFCGDGECPSGRQLLKRSLRYFALKNTLVWSLLVLTSDWYAFRHYSVTWLIAAFPLEAICTEISISPPGVTKILWRLRIVSVLRPASSFVRPEKSAQTKIPECFAHSDCHYCPYLRLAYITYSNRLFPPFSPAPGGDTLRPQRVNIAFRVGR
eukprot:6173115-Pleurochrysis_carterae.AAC.2